MEEIAPIVDASVRREDFAGKRLAGPAGVSGEQRGGRCEVKGKLIVGLSSLTILAATAGAQVTSERLSNAGQEPQNWLMYSGDYAGGRFSSLQEIKIGNAEKLVPKWAYQTWLAENLKPRRWQ